MNESVVHGKETLNGRAIAIKKRVACLPVLRFEGLATR